MYTKSILITIVVGILIEASASSSSSSSEEMATKQSGFYCDPADPGPLPINKICDRVNDCPNMVDEVGCQPHTCPKPGTFFCGFEDCASVDLYCNGVIDCDADEQYCLNF